MTTTLGLVLFLALIQKPAGFAITSYTSSPDFNGSPSSLTKMSHSRAELFMKLTLKLALYFPSSIFVILPKETLAGEMSTLAIPLPSPTIARESTLTKNAKSEAMLPFETRKRCSSCFVFLSGMTPRYRAQGSTFSIQI